MYNTFSLKNVKCWSYKKSAIVKLDEMGVLLLIIIFECNKISKNGCLLKGTLCQQIELYIVILLAFAIISFYFKIACIVRVEVYTLRKIRIECKQFFCLRHICQYHGIDLYSEIMKCV